MILLLLALQLPAQVTTLSVSAVTDTSAVLTWTEVPSGTSAVARYAIRLAGANILTGGCAAPVYGSTAAGGRKRSCVLGGLRANTAVEVQVIAYRGNLTTTTAIGPPSNVAQIITAERIGPLLVLRPRVLAGDSVWLRSAWISAYPDTFPLRGWFTVGGYWLAGFGLGDSLVAHGYLFVVRP